MSKDAEIDMKEVELNELEPEKQPMTGSDGPASGGGGGEQNGNVKLKVPDEDVKFTGLSKEELMRVAGTPGWVRTRWALLILFWLGWVGMLAGAIVIIVQAPRCKDIPEQNWWNEGPLYQINDLQAFTEDGNIKGVEQKLDSLNQLKVKGLVLGPLHTVQTDQASTLDLMSIDAEQGSEQDLRSLLDKAHKKGISVVLDLTPNYKGSDVWFSDLPGALDKVTTAAEFWLATGVDGIKVKGLSAASASPDWSKVQAAVQANRTEEDKTAKKKMLMGVVEGQTSEQVSVHLNSSKVDLLLSDLLITSSGGKERIQAVDDLLAAGSQRGVAWGLGASRGEHLSKMAAGRPGLVRLYQLLLLTLPGTPVVMYGDEIGLSAQGDKSPMMLWDTEEAPAEGTAVNQTAEAEREERAATRKWFKSLSDLRGKERSLLHGDYTALSFGPAHMVFLRLWDQSDRFVSASNWGDAELPVTLDTAKFGLPDQAKVKLSTDTALEAESMLDLSKFTLKPGQAVLLHFPYVA